MAIKYPDKPWVDGQTHQYELADGTFIFMVYDEQKNTWTVGRKNEDGQGGSTEFITTADVATLNARPTAVNSPFELTDEPGTVINQQEANWWLFEDLDKRARKAIVSDTTPTSHPLYTTSEKELIRGDLWVNTAQDILFWYDGSYWQEFSGGRPPIFSDTEPLVHPDFKPPNDSLISGDLWYDTTDPDEIVQYIYDGSDWIKTGGEYVHRKGGDSMEGPLKVTGDRNPNADGIESTIKVLNVDSGQSSTLNLKWHGQTKAYLGDDQLTLTNDLKFNVGGKHIYAEGPDKKGFTVNKSGVFYDGAYSNERHVATKKNVDEAIFNDPIDLDSNKYVDRTGDIMSGDLILEESRLVFRNPDGDQTLIRANRDSGAYPVLLDLVNNNTVGATPGGYDIKIGGSTSYNQLRFRGQDTYLSINGGGGSTTPVKFHKDVDCGNSRFTNLGNAVDDKDAVPYGQVKQEVLDKFNEYVSTISFGQYSYRVTVTPTQGQFATYSAGGASTEPNPSAVRQLWIHGKNAAGEEIGINSLNPGDLIRLNKGTDLHEFRVNGTPVEQSGGSGGWYKIEVNRGEGITLTTTDAYDIALLKLTGGSVDLDDYVKKAGDTMTGDLAMSGKQVKNLASVNFQNVGTIKANDNNRITVRNAANGDAGNADVSIARPPASRRGFAIEGQTPDGANTDIFWSYTNASGGDAVNYEGKMSNPTNILNRKEIENLIAAATGGGGGGGAAGENFISHGPWHFAGVNSAVGTGQFTSNNTGLKKIRQFTFHNKNTSGEDQTWSDLQPGEVITIVQQGDFSSVGGDANGWAMVNYEVTEVDSFSTATILNVSAHWSVLVYSSGYVQYSPSDLFTFLTDVDTYVLESQPATLNNVVQMAKKTSAGPAFGVYRLSSSTSEGLGGVNKGQFICSGNLQTPTRFIFACEDHYGNGQRWGANSINCNNSILELYRKNADGTLCLCRVYRFNDIQHYGNGTKFEVRNITPMYTATGGTDDILNPGTMVAGENYLCRFKFSFGTSTAGADLPYTIDAEDDTHWGDHRLEDVGYPVDPTDAATKGYVDSAIQTATKNTWEYKSIVSIPPLPGSFSFDNGSTTFYISGTSAEGTKLLDTTYSPFNDYNITGMGSLYDQAKGGVLTGFFKFGTVRVQSYGGGVYYKITRTGYAKQQLTDGNNYEIKISGLL
jgi:hypothetical protein